MNFSIVLKLTKFQLIIKKQQTLQKYLIIPQGNLIQPLDINEYSKAQIYLSFNLLIK